MNFVDQISESIEQQWGAKTLAEFRKEAAKELNGSFHESLQTSEGLRLILVICLTGEHEIKNLQSKVDLDPSGSSADWQSATIANLVLATMQGPGLNYEAEYRQDGQPSAVVLFCTDPTFMQMLEKLFNLPQ